MCLWLALVGPQPIYLSGPNNLAQNGTACLLHGSISSIGQSASMSSIVGAGAGTVSSEDCTAERLVELRPRPHLRHPAMQDPPPIGETQDRYPSAYSCSNATAGCCPFSLCITLISKIMEMPSQPYLKPGSTRFGWRSHQQS